LHPLNSVLYNDLECLEWLSKMFYDTQHRAVSLRQLSFLLTRVSTAMLTPDINMRIMSIYSSRSGIVLKRLNMSSYFLQRMLPPPLSPVVNTFLTGSSPTGVWIQDVWYWIQVWYVNFATFNQYLSTWQRYSYYGTVIKNNMRSIETWHFRWPWVTFEGHFSTYVTLCAQLTRDVLAIAKFLVIVVLTGINCRGSNEL